nr:hypothetical protein [uncultured Clostridium sp.]
MISCDKSNRSSAKVAVKNGGILSGEGYDEESEAMVRLGRVEREVIPDPFAA